MLSLAFTTRHRELCSLDKGLVSMPMVSSLETDMNGKLLMKGLQKSRNQLPLISAVTAFCYSIFNTQIL